MLQKYVNESLKEGKVRTPVINQSKNTIKAQVEIEIDIKTGIDERLKY